MLLMNIEKQVGDFEPMTTQAQIVAGQTLAGRRGGIRSGMMELVKYDAACQAIAEAKAVDEVKDIHDKAK